MAAQTSMNFSYEVEPLELFQAKFGSNAHPFTYKLNDEQVNFVARAVILRFGKNEDSKSFAQITTETVKFLDSYIKEDINEIEKKQIVFSIVTTVVKILGVKHGYKHTPKIQNNIHIQTNQAIEETFAKVDEARIKKYMVNDSVANSLATEQSRKSICCDNCCVIS